MQKIAPKLCFTTQMPHLWQYRAPDALARDRPAQAPPLRQRMDRNGRALPAVAPAKLVERCVVHHVGYALGLVRHAPRGIIITFTFERSRSRSRQLASTLRPVIDTTKARCHVKCFAAPPSSAPRKPQSD